jgi:biopolymer transport protein ExbD
LQTKQLTTDKNEIFMGLKKRSGVSAEFSLASLTDIIFLLLLFFMLTSTLVKIQPFELPESDTKTVAPVTVVVTIEKSGRHTLNNQEIDPKAVTRAMGTALTQAGNQPDATVTIVAEVGAPFGYVVDVMEAAAKNKARAIIATQPKS